MALQRAICVFCQELNTCKKFLSAKAVLNSANCVYGDHYSQSLYFGGVFNAKRRITFGSSALTWLGKARIYCQLNMSRLIQ